MMILSFVVVSLCDDVRMCGGWGGGVASTSVVQVLLCMMCVYCVCACYLLLVIFTGTFLARVKYECHL